MMLKACQQNLTLSIHVLCVHKIVSKIKMKTFNIARSNTIEIRISLARVANGIKRHKHYHQKSTIGCSQQQMMVSHRERCS
jgi:hypothetical protein